MTDSDIKYKGYTIRLMFDSTLDILDVDGDLVDGGFNNIDEAIHYIDMGDE